MNSTVADHGGARISGAKVTLTDIGTNIAKVAETAQDGTFHFAQLKPSRYRLNVAAPGFKESVVETIDLHPQDTLAEDITLEVGSASEQVQVNAQTEQLDTTSSISTTVDRKFVENMPLNGRSFQALIALTPGKIDGVSANVGITQGSNVYLGTGGGTAQATATMAVTIISSPSMTCRSKDPDLDLRRRVWTHHRRATRHHYPQRHQPVPRHRLRIPAQ